jgi:hypothetical protein
VQIPAIGLIVMAILNLLGGGYWVLNGFAILRMSPDELTRQLTQSNPQAPQQMKQMGWTVEGTFHTLAYLFIGAGGAGLVLSFLTVVGAIRMLQLRSYGLAMFVSILNAVPLLSTTACCGVGEIVGIWAIVVLLNSEVRASFR